MKVKFVPQNVEFEIKPGESVMHLAEDNGLYVKSVCRGVPSCAECRVKIVEGETNVFAPVAAELGLIGSGYFIDRRRLACQLQCIGDVTVDMSEQIAKQQGLLGGRKAKAAKAIGDRVEDETVIRDSSASGMRSSGRSGGRDRDDDENDELDESDETAKPQTQGRKQDRGGDKRNQQRPQPPKSNVVIGGNARPQVGTGTVVPDSGPSPVAPAAGSPASGSPIRVGPAGGGIQPRPQGAPPEGGRPGGGQGGGQGGGGGRSRRGGRRR